MEQHLNITDFRFFILNFQVFFKIGSNLKSLHLVSFVHFKAMIMINVIYINIGSSQRKHFPLKGVCILVMYGGELKSQGVTWSDVFSHNVNVA